MLLTVGHLVRNKMYGQGNWLSLRVIKVICINLEGKGFSDRNLKDTEIKRQEIHRWINEGN